MVRLHCASVELVLVFKISLSNFPFSLIFTSIHFPFARFLSLISVHPPQMAEPYSQAETASKERLDRLSDQLKHLVASVATVSNSQSWWPVSTLKVQLLLLRHSSPLR